MGDRRCCCACFIWEDDFDRADSSDIGEWTEISGDWEIASNRLYEPGTAGAIALGTNTVSGSPGEMAVKATFCDATTGMIYELYAASDATATSYFKSEHELLANGNWKTTIYKNAVAHSSVEQAPTPWEGDEDLVRGWICVERDGNVKAGVVSVDEYAWDVNLGGLTGTHFGVGHQNSGDTYFDDFYVTELRTPTKLCTDCWCTCCLTFPQRQLDITFTNCVDRAACLEGETTTLDWEWDAGLEPWTGTITINNGDGDNVWDFRLECDGTADPNCQGANWNLEVTAQCAAGCGGGCTSYAISSSKCDPLTLVFGPYSYTSGLLGCTACYPVTFPPTGPATGSYYLTVTMP